ncbi:sensor domain-containing diguanylate cyclase [Psychrobacillus psychrodurans]|uniref:Sensor domain-containing diguanylate cyclase n=1 Tax=Psychrobacillus psychrodurans TaxID=126157 RepID=A0A9X3LA94_9BACI|nr:sensor domain-containing diguanylate cyclase [Psychrobacillus psychrodurans]MCZ8532434.1 sensor domain-containing diguanylate cyclase [Psychrobacillus psychrodurans]
MKTLRFWTLSLICFIMFGIIVSTFSSSYFVTKKILVENSLEQNRVYSMKLAHMTDEVFSYMQSNLEARKSDVIKHLNDPKTVTNILQQLNISGENFNSLSVINDQGIAIATTPNIGIVGSKISSFGVKEAFARKEAFISKPYYAQTGRLLILITTPLFGDSGEYLGMLNGTVYLEEDNFIRDILAEHYSQDGSYVYVVDRDGTLIYHPNKTRIGESVESNLVVQKLLEEKSGALQLDNTLGTNFLAGYTYIEKSKWGVVSQTPYTSALKPLSGIMLTIFIFSLPFIIIFLVSAFYVSTKLASPLRKLAINTLRDVDDQEEVIDVPTWYFEAKQLTMTIENYRKRQRETVESMKEISVTDPLTGLKNRRYADILFGKLFDQQTNFSIIMLDIDHFKQVNDKYGHIAGDDVLKFISIILKDLCSEQGECIRLGGEEFLVLLSKKDIQAAYILGEHIRMTIENSVPPIQTKLTVSLGVGEYKCGETQTQFMNRIDLALYEAKANGRNNTVIAKLE